MRMNHPLFLFGLLIYFTCSHSAAQTNSDCSTIIGGYIHDNTDCSNCQFIRAQYNVPDPDTILINDLSSGRVDLHRVSSYYCGDRTGNLTVSISITVSETVSFTGSTASARIGLSAAIVAQGTFQLPVTGENETVSNTVSAGGSQNNVPPCEGIAMVGDYTKFTTAAFQTVYGVVEHYRCNCTVFGTGFVLENIGVDYYCRPTYVRAWADLVKPRPNGNAWLRTALLDAPRAPSADSPPACEWCDIDGGGGDDLDPDGDEDGDGIPNGQDDTPYGYTGDDPDGDDDGDGIPNKDDPTPYGYDGNDPDGDDDGDGIPNHLDPTPDGELKRFNIPNYNFELPTLLLS